VSEPTEPAPLAGAIREHARRLGLEGRADDVAGAWPGAVGEEIARNAWPARVQADGTLVVHVRDAIWGFELTQRASEIADRLPGSPALKFVPGPLPDTGPPAPAAGPPVPAASPEQRREAGALAAEIADPELRALVARTAAASLARSASPARDGRPV
jgi:Dna[CI] antecedent, DciA